MQSSAPLQPRRSRRRSKAREEEAAAAAAQAAAAAAAAAGSAVQVRPLCWYSCCAFIPSGRHSLGCQSAYQAHCALRSMFCALCRYMRWRMGVLSRCSAAILSWDLTGRYGCMEAWSWESPLTRKLDQVRPVTCLFLAEDQVNFGRDVSWFTVSWFPQEHTDCSPIACSTCPGCALCAGGHALRNAGLEATCVKPAPHLWR